MTQLNGQDAGNDPLAGLQSTYADLPAQFYSALAPTPVAAPRLIKLNAELADQIGLDPAAMAEPAGVAALAGNRVPADARPIAAVYAGHQFGGFVPQLGDGRAILLGEIVGRDGVRRDIQLKGSGPTPYSRMGDGRAAIGPVLREYIVAEAMAALGIATTRALAAVATGEVVMREAPLPGAVLTRVAQSHIRVGTFQYFAARGDLDGLRALADYAIARHDPDAADADNPYRVLLDRVVTRQAELVARWLNVGFIHGVMNTDNVSIAGETIDYGPCAFMDAYDPAAVFSSIDRGGRYSYGNQPNIAHWNLACFAHALMPLLGPDETAQVDEAKAAVSAFPAQFEQAWQEGLSAKLGLVGAHDDGDDALKKDWLALLALTQADFTLAFRSLSDVLRAVDGAVDELSGVVGQGGHRDVLEAWVNRWRLRVTAGDMAPGLTADRMDAVNPLYIPRNHLVEAAIAAAMAGDEAPFHDLVDVCSRPFDAQTGRAAYATPPAPHEVVQQTFCGT